MSPQNMAILWYMWQTNKPIDRGIAMSKLNIAKLPTRISELRAEGWDLPHKMTKNETNQGSHAVYYMSANDMERYNALRGQDG